jgi:hypothetical protein
MKAQTPTEAEKEMRARIVQACVLMDDEPNLRLLRDDYLDGEQSRLAAEALAILEQAATLEQFSAAKSIAIARVKVRAFQQSLVKMANDAKKEAEKPATSP